MTPLRLLFRSRPWLLWLAEHRGDLGAAAFAYAGAHAAIYAFGRGDLGVVLREGRAPWLLAGWAALLIFIVFAATTDDAATRLLRGSWRWLHRWDRAHTGLDRLHAALKRVHRLVYLGAVLVLVHWALAAFDPLTVQVQSALYAYGYYNGPIDGLIGPESRAALRLYQQGHGLPETGTITPEVLDRLGIVPN